MNIYEIMALGVTVAIVIIVALIFFPRSCFAILGSLYLFTLDEVSGESFFGMIFVGIFVLVCIIMDFFMEKWFDGYRE